MSALSNCFVVLVFFLVGCSAPHDGPNGEEPSLELAASDGSGGDNVVSARVAASADDAEERGGRMSLSSTDLELTVDGSYRQVVGIRFAGLTIPRGATITGARVQFTVDEKSSSGTSLMVRGHAHDNSGSFTLDRNDVSARARTNAVVSWAPPSWTTVGAAGSGQQTPELAAIVQEIVDRPGWVAGNALALIIEGTGHRAAEAFDGDSRKAPLLTVHYVPPSIDEPESPGTPDPQDPSDPEQPSDPQEPIDPSAEPGPLTSARAPSVIGGVYAESSSFIGPFADANGNLYTVTEVSAADPRPCIRKSRDGGRSWSEVDAANRPSSKDLESVWLVQDGSRIHMLHQRSGSSAMNVYYNSFNTSDASSAQDRWVVRDELVAAPAIPDNQAVALVRRSNGDLVAFYRTAASGSYERVAFKVKTVGGSFGSEVVIDDSSGKSFTQVTATLGTSDVIHVFYKNDTDNEVRYKTLSASGTLSAWRSVEENPTHSDYQILATPPVMVRVSDMDRVVTAWKRASTGRLVGVALHGGLVGPEEVISEQTVLENPSRVSSHQTVATLAADPATGVVYALYSDASTGDLWVDARSSTWRSDVEVLDNTRVEIVSATVLRHSAANGGKKVLAVVYDDGSDTSLADNVVKYTEVVLE